MTNARHRILDGALELLRAEGGGTITLDATAKQVGLTKPGLMYHFPTKEALMLAVVDHVAERWEALLQQRLGQLPVCLCLGAEGQGLSAEVRQLCREVSVPQSGKDLMESLNVSAAGAILMFALSQGAAPLLAELSAL